MYFDCKCHFQGVNYGSLLTYVADFEFNFFFVVSKISFFFFGLIRLDLLWSSLESSRLNRYLVGHYFISGKFFVFVFSFYMFLFFFIVIFLVFGDCLYQ